MAPEAPYVGGLGITWCVKHHGVINEDETHCDMLDRQYPDDDDLDDEGEFLPCDTRELVYVATEADRAS
jgi:hypothetical protein